MIRTLYLYGGWPGHKPYEIAAEWARPLLARLGFEVEETNEIFALDADLTCYDLIVLNWNNALLSEGLTVAQENRLVTGPALARVAQQRSHLIQLAPERDVLGGAGHGHLGSTAEGLAQMIRLACSARSRSSALSEPRSFLSRAATGHSLPNRTKIHMRQSTNDKQRHKNRCHITEIFDREVGHSCRCHGRARIVVRFDVRAH